VGDASEQVQLRVLGSFEVLVGGHVANLGGARQRLVLAGLVASRNAVVSHDRLVDIVWGDEPPDTALTTVQKYVHRLRAALGDRIVTRSPGYLLRVDDGEYDVARFESLLLDATRLTTAGELGEAMASFDAALGLWRGPAWADFADFDFARGDAARLEGLRATAIEDRTEVALATGRHAEVIGDLEATVACYPLRERPRAQLMLALYRSGRHADALRAYDVFRRYLGEEVGLEPSASLAQLNDAIVLQQPELDWAPPPGARGRAALPSGTVTFLFSDIEGSTRLFRQLGHSYVDLLERHRRLVRAAVATTGGVEVNSEGDGLFFAFSSAAAALAASVAAQQALVTEVWPPGAEVRVRMGLHTGEAAPHDGDYVAIAVHQAARVRDAAHGGQVLLSQTTAGAIGDALPGECSVAALGTFPLKDFERGVELFEARHPALTGSFPPPRVDGAARRLPQLPAPLAADSEPLVGRTSELEWLEVLWQRAAGGEGEAALVYGPPGIGKSRLVAEFARRVHGSGATVALSVPAAPGGPVLAVLDDFDGSVLPVPGAGVLVLAAARHAVAGTANTRELRGLTADEVGLLLAHKIEAVTLDLTGAVHTETHGNPGHVHDVARRLCDREAEERVQRALDRVGSVNEEARQLRAEIAGGVLRRERLAALADERVALGVCPYKGLARYEAADAAFFYGRERLVATLVARIAVDRFVGIIGASGSGKSSLVRAGLLPALSAGALPGSGTWPTCTFTPGEHPMRSFALALAPLTDIPGPELARRLDRQPDELGGVLEAAVRGREGARVVVIVDQFEEVATLCRDQDERERFAAALVDAVTDRSVPAVVVPVVRADYHRALTVHPELARLFEQSQLLVGAMGDSDLRRAITEPARRAALALEGGLVDAVCADAGSEPGALPLVSTAMAETWARRVDGVTLTIAGYRDAGGVHGALARLADDVYGGLDEEVQALARPLFLRLAEPGEGNDDVRRRMPRGEVGGGDDAVAVLDAFVDRRLLIADTESVEVAHEALLREWPRLRGWLEEDRAGRRLLRQLTLAAASWDGEGRDPGSLYRGTRLDAALEWAGAHTGDVNAVEREFLDASVDAQHSDLQRARQTARRLRSLAGAMAVFLAIALIAGGLALVQRSHAKRQAAAANAARTVSDATAIASQARVLNAGQLDLALLLAAQGRRLHESAATDGALEAVLARVPPGVDSQVPLVDIGVIFSTDASPNGNLVAAGRPDGTARLLDPRTGRVVRTLLANPGVSPIQFVAFSDDGTRLTGSDLNGDVYVWDVATGRRLGATIHADTSVGTKGGTRTTFAGDNRIVTATSSGVIRVWDFTDPVHPAAIGAAFNAGVFMLGTSVVPPHTFLAGGSDMLAFDDAGHTEVWDIRTHTRAYPPLPGGASGESPDGSTLATAAGSQVLLWDLATGRRRGQPLDGFTVEGPGPLVLFSPDGRRAAIPVAPSYEGGEAVVDLRSGSRVGNPIPGLAVRYLDDGRVAVELDQAIELWRPGATVPVTFATALQGSTPGFAHWLSPGTVYGLPDSFSLEPYGLSGTFALGGPALEWDASTGKLVGDLLGRPQPPTTSVFLGASIVNRDGTIAGLAEGGTVELWDIAHHRQAALLNAQQLQQRQPAATWDPAADILATTGRGGTLALWDTSDVAHIKLLARTTVPGYKPAFAPLAYFSPDGHTIAMQQHFFASSRATSLVSVPDARVQRVLTADTGFVSFGAAFTSDSRTVAIIDISFSGNAQVDLWDVATGRHRSTRTVPYPALGGAAFVNGNRWLVTTESGQLRPETAEQLTSRVDIWDVATLQPVGEPITVRGDAILAEADLPGGSRLLTSTSVATGSDMVWDLDPSHWAVLACSIAGRNLTQAEWRQYLSDRPYQRTCPQWAAGP
jgi:DNA-binding SARP family transcriptional activator/class 3 adenylate cyclase/WD40 repeat protein